MADTPTYGGNGGNEGVDIFDRTNHTTANFRGLHRTKDETLDDCAGYSVHQLTWEGAYTDILGAYNAVYTNELVTSSDTFMPVPFSGGMDMIVTNKSMRSTGAGRGQCTFTIKGYKKVYEGNIDFERVDKDIRTWRALCINDKPDLGVIQLWEQCKDTGRVDLWKDFKYIDGSGQEQEIPDSTATRALAGMMYRGVESYPEYYPVLNLTITFPKHPCELNINDFRVGALLGKVVDAADITPTGYGIPIGDISGASSPVNDFEALEGDYILCTADKLQNNSDGTYTLQRSFAKFRLVEKELYVGAGGTYSPYDQPNDSNANGGS